jgi:hypothetical protein
MAATGGKIKKKYGIEDTNVSLREAVEVRLDEERRTGGE